MSKSMFWKTTDRTQKKYKRNIPDSVKSQVTLHPRFILVTRPSCATSTTIVLWTRKRQETTWSAYVRIGPGTERNCRSHSGSKNGATVQSPVKVPFSSGSNLGTSGESRFGVGCRLRRARKTKNNKNEHLNKKTNFFQQQVSSCFHMWFVKVEASVQMWKFHSAQEATWEPPENIERSWLPPTKEKKNKQERTH